MKSLAPRIPAIAVLAVGCADKQQRLRHSDQRISFLEEPGRSGMASRQTSQMSSKKRQKSVKKVVGYKKKR